MTDRSQQSEAQDGDRLSTLNSAIRVFNTVKVRSSVTPVQAAFDTVTVLLALIRVSPLLLSYNERLQAHT